MYQITCPLSSTEFFRSSQFISLIILMLRNLAMNALFYNRLEAQIRRETGGWPVVAKHEFDQTFFYKIQENTYKEKFPAVFILLANVLKTVLVIYYCLRIYSKIYQLKTIQTSNFFQFLWMGNPSTVQQALCLHVCNQDSTEQYPLPSSFSGCCKDYCFSFCYTEGFICWTEAVPSSLPCGPLYIKQGSPGKQNTKNLYKYIGRDWLMPL